MGLRRRRRSGSGGSPGRGGRADQALAEQHLEQFVATRSGVEAYLEPRTNFTEDTVVLVAATGEWTRRRVADPRTARSLAGRLGIPVYDVAATGYPKRMREWTARRKAAGETGVPRYRES